MDSLKDILRDGTEDQVRTTFSFGSDAPAERIAKKFNLWARYFFLRYFPSNDAPFHRDIDLLNARLYRGDISSFLNICFRGAAKTTRTKLFVAFCILNDLDHRRRYIKVLSRDSKNSTQFVTDIYNMMVQPRVKALYPETFMKTATKREETMSSFTTATGVKLASGTVGSSQRGQIQDETRPDLIVYDDFEDRTTLRSAVTSQMIWDNMEEAKNGLSKDGGSIYLCNYISERGNVHRLVQKTKEKLIVPIIANDIPSWDRYTREEIYNIRENAEDFEGEYLCEPSAGADVYFDRSTLDRQEKKRPIREIAGFKIFHKYQSGHRYGLGADVAGGVGLDSSTTTIIDFSTTPARVVATFANNEIDPNSFGDEIVSQGDRFGGCIVAPENNKFDQTIGRIRHLNYENIFFTNIKETRAGLPPRTRSYGWNTNTHTKNKIITTLKQAVADGHLELSDPDLIAEMRSYTRDDFMENEVDPRLTTRHFDLVISCAIAYEMRNHAEAKSETDSDYQQAAYERSGLAD